MKQYIQAYHSPDNSVGVLASFYVEGDLDKVRDVLFVVVLKLAKSNSAHADDIIFSSGVTIPQYLTWVSHERGIPVQLERFSRWKAAR